MKDRFRKHHSKSVTYEKPKNDLFNLSKDEEENLFEEVKIEDTVEKKPQPIIHMPIPEPKNLENLPKKLVFSEVKGLQIKEDVELEKPKEAPVFANSVQNKKPPAIDNAS